MTGDFELRKKVGSAFPYYPGVGWTFRNEALCVNTDFLGIVKGFYLYFRSKTPISAA